MTYWQFALLMAAVHVAPTLSAKSRTVFGVLWLLFAVLALCVEVLT